MKLVTFRHAGNTSDRVGVLTGSARHVVDLSGSFSDMLALIDAGESGLATARDAQRAAQDEIPLEQVQLRAPLPEPRQMRDAMTFELHYKQSMKYMARLRAGQAVGRLADAAGLLRLPRIWY